MAFNRGSIFLRRAVGSANLLRGNRYSPTALAFPACSPSLSTPTDHIEGDCNKKTFSSDSASAYHLQGGPSHMRAAVFWEPNKPLTLEDFHIPRPKANEVLIKTKGIAIIPLQNLVEINSTLLELVVSTSSCGVCHSDLHVIKGELPFASPCVVGHEITGEVVEHGPLTDSKIVERFPVGAQVVGAFIMPCGSCGFCSKGQDDLCEAFFAYNRAKGTLYDGETRLFFRSSGKPAYMYSMGGLAEYCVVPAHGLAVLPNSLPYTESAILGCAVFTAYGAMAHAAQVRPGDAIAIIGIGGVGSSCLQIARAFGASEIIAVDVQDEKLQKAKALGATHTINSRNEDAVKKIKEITGGMGVDIAVEALGRTQTFGQCVQSVRDGGKAVMIGLTLSGAKGEVDINHLVRRQIKVIGSYGARARQDLPKLIKLAESGIFNLRAAVSRKCKFEEAAEAYKDLDKGNITGRAVVEIM
nr:alcohol dehydrogenase 1B [Ipomoea batatas]